MSIVLTGTITPRAPMTAYADVQVRRREYLDSIRFYRQFAPVIFLENSGYDLRGDAAFAALADCELCQMPLSEQPQRGKGYQEFEMLDAWLQHPKHAPTGFIKITGRYRYENFAALLSACRRTTASLIIDMHPRTGRALTSLFAVEVAYYRQHFIGLYRECDDVRGDWIERVLYRHLSRLSDDSLRVFPVEPRLLGHSGSTGESLTAPIWKHRLKAVSRAMNISFDARRLWYVS